MSLTIHSIAHIRTDFKEKFGIPRQSGRVDSLVGRIIFCQEYRHPDALRGIEEFSHLWLLFDFSKSHRDSWTPTVRPPRLGGNQRIGVFASRSPFRPNSIGLSCVRLLRVEQTTNEGAVLVVAGADLLDGTPILDIKPYLPYADSIPDARGSYGEAHSHDHLSVSIPDDLLQIIPHELHQVIHDVLAEDPRPSYHDDPQRIYSMRFAEFDIHFKVQQQCVIVTEIDTVE